MLIDRYLPTWDATLVRDVHVSAPPDVTWDAIRTADLADPLINALFALRELPQRLAHRDVAPRRMHVTFNDLTDHDGPGFVTLAEVPGEQLVVGSIGRFWQKDYGGHPFVADAFTAFNEPGWAKLVVSFRVRPAGDGGTHLRYEARTATTDPVARDAFRRYWRMIRPGVALVMHRALQRIREEAERHAVTPMTRFIPLPDVRDRHEILIHAPAADVFAAMATMQLDDSRVVRAIFRLRELALSVAHGREPVRRVPPAGLLEQTKAMGWGVLAETPHRLVVMGATAKPWQRDVTFHALPPEEFAAHLEPDCVKIVWTLEAIPVRDDVTIARTETSVVATDPIARRRFLRYWRIFSPGIRMIRRVGLRMVKRDAERLAGRGIGRSAA